VAKMSRPDEPSSANITPARAGQAQFTETNWSMVLRAGHPDQPGAEAALERLCRTYWYPVYAWVRGQGPGPEDARDLTQGFFAALLRRESLSTVCQEKGRFRTFIIRSLQNFLVDQHRMRSAEKRGGGRALVDLDALNPEELYRMEPAMRDTPDAAFDRRWGQAIVIKAMERLAEEQKSDGQESSWALLAGFVGHEPDAGDYESAAAQLGAPVNSVAVLVRRLRLRCRELIMQEIMHTVQTRREAKEELRALFGK
jgi:DNA-directed RNA polymerase specialized sigma24 family protein